jgi:hypothetical protein
MGFQPFLGKEPHRYCGWGSRAVRGKVKETGTPKSLNYYVIFIANT